VRQNRRQGHQEEEEKTGKLTKGSEGREERRERRSRRRSLAPAVSSGGGGAPISARASRGGEVVRVEQGSGAPFIGWRRKGRGRARRWAARSVAAAINGMKLGGAWCGGRYRERKGRGRLPG
jgi:hypothetical protein